MSYLHSLSPQIIHRDLKSKKVLLATNVISEYETPLAKVTDFGLSRALQAGRILTQGIGTWRWMAPEMFSSQNYTEKVDVFSFSMVVYELLAKKLPYHDKW